MKFDINVLRTKLVEKLGKTPQADNEAERIMNLIHTDNRDENLIVLSRADIHAIGENNFILLKEALEECYKETHINIEIQN